MGTGDIGKRKLDGPTVRLMSTGLAEPWQERPLLRLLGATKGACEDKTLVRPTLAEKVILSAVRAQNQDAKHIAYVLCASRKRSQTSDPTCQTR